jgi:hypothetical protein
VDGSHEPGVGAVHAHRIERLIAVCRRRGWAAAQVPGEGPRPCRPDDPGAFVHLERAVFWLEQGERGVHGAEGGSAVGG